MTLDSAWRVWMKKRPDDLIERGQSKLPRITVAFPPQVQNLMRDLNTQEAPARKARSYEEVIREFAEALPKPLNVPDLRGHVVDKYRPDQAREHGRFADEGRGGIATPKDHPSRAKKEKVFADMYEQAKRDAGGERLLPGALMEGRVQAWFKDKHSAQIAFHLPRNAEDWPGTIKQLAEFSTCIDEHPYVAGEFKDVTIGERPSWVSWGHEGSWGVSRSLEGKIWINSIVLTPNAWRQTITPTLATSPNGAPAYHDGMDDPRMVMRHEFGHILDTYLRKGERGLYNVEGIEGAATASGWGTVRGTLNRIIERYEMGENRSWVSGYAGISSQEWFAETFAGMVYGDARAKAEPAVKSMTQFLRDVRDAYKRNKLQAEPITEYHPTFRQLAVPANLAEPAYQTHPAWQKFREKVQEGLKFYVRRLGLDTGHVR